MKVIDLLNKTANGEEVPKKIHIKQFQSDFIFNGRTYLSDEKEKQNIYWCLHSDALNYEVEIIEEDKEIEELDMCYSDELEEYVVQTYINGNYYKEVYNSRYDEMIINKINELIKTVNELKKGK